MDSCAECKVLKRKYDTGVVTKIRFVLFSSDGFKVNDGIEIWDSNADINWSGQVSVCWDIPNTI
jgi:hypothetical protein